MNYKFDDQEIDQEIDQESIKKMIIEIIKMNLQLQEMAWQIN